ncbi:MAG: hypothetical protein HYY01_08275 [Chloroflexi bacterium]|nr:hypothetical protein [Chloroflexota bacterium]
MSSAVDGLIRGAIDVHAHAGPDGKRERRMDTAEMAQYARGLGMGGVVVKSHTYPTAPVVALARRSVSDVELFGSLTLNEEVGGLNPAAVEVSAGLGARVLWMPTESATQHLRKKGLDSVGISLLDSGGKLVPEVGQILEIAREHHMSLATGHVSGPEVIALCREAKRLGIPLLITHPLLSGSVPDLSVEELKGLADGGALLELCFMVCMPLGQRVPPADFAATVRGLGAERVVLSSDGGQDWLPPAPELLRMGIAVLLRAGLSPEEIELMVRVNPARWLSLER